MPQWEPEIDDHDRRPKQRQRRQGRGIVTFLWVVIVLLVVVAAGFGASFFTGAISIAQPTAAPVPNPVPRPAANQGTAGAQSTGGQQAATGAAQAPADQNGDGKPVVTKTQTFKDWVFSCVKRAAADTDQTCSIVQQLSDSQTKTPLFQWRITKTDKGLVGEWQTRTGILVDRGIVLDAGTPKPVAIPFQLCTPTGCQAVANLAPDFIDTLSKTPKATATVFPIGQKGITLSLSVAGLPDALAALK